MRFLAAVFILNVLAAKIWAYPQFIGYGYSTCITCHYNGHGNGPLNDYGRAVWAAEIAGRAFAGNKTDEQLGEASGFWGKQTLPWWIRPGLKTRDIYVQTNPNGTNSASRHILMQAEGSLALAFDKKSDFLFVGSYGYAPDPQRLKGQTNIEKQPNVISHEHYFRWHTTKSLWLYMGLTDKTYGLRHINHTAYSRRVTGLAQHDQSHGLIAHYIRPEWEVSVNPFFGNLSQAADLRQKGFASLFDYEIENNWRFGISLLSSKNDYVKQERFAMHSRAGYGDGAALLWELGITQNTPTTSESKMVQGVYFYSELVQRIFRGYHLFITGQAYKADTSKLGPENFKAGAGLLMFPMSRLELRFEVENSRNVAEETMTGDNWVALSQLHISL